MSNANRVLPNLEALNPTELKALIVSQHELIVSRDSEIEQLKLLIAKLRRMQFGRSSEKLDRQIEQLELRLEALQQNDAETVAAMPEQIASVEPGGSIGAAPAAGTPASGSANPSAEAEGVPGLRRRATQVGGRRFRSVGAYTVSLSGDPACSCQAGLCVLRTHRASRGAEPADRAWYGRTRASGPRAGLEIWRSLAVVSSVRNLRTGRGRAGSLDVGGLGGRNQPTVRTTGGSVATSRDERSEAARR